MAYSRNIYIEHKTLEFYKRISPELRKFPINLRDISKCFPNIIIKSYQSLAKQNDISVQDICVSCNTENGCCFHKNNKFIILYNNDKSICIERRKYTILHEIGHIELKHFDLIKSQCLSDNPLKNSVIEHEADYFAACVLCPMPILYKIKPQSPHDIKKYFHISSKAADIAWYQYTNYNKFKNITYHNDLLKLCNFPILKT